MRNYRPKLKIVFVNLLKQSIDLFIVRFSVGWHPVHPPPIFDWVGSESTLTYESPDPLLNLEALFVAHHFVAEFRYKFQQLCVERMPSFVVNKIFHG